MLKESVYREKQYMYSVFHSSNKEDEEQHAKHKAIKKQQKEPISIALIQ